MKRRKTIAEYNADWPHPERCWPERFHETLDRFFANEASRVPGLDSYDDQFTSELFFPLQRRRELEKMIRLARSVNPVTVFDLGADKGASTYAWIKSIPSVHRVIAGEIRGCPYQEHFEEHFPEVDFLWVEKSSYADSTVREIRSFLGGDKIDVAFLDGDKSQFFLDFELYRPMVRDGGIMFMHDIQDSDPRRAFSQIQELGYRTEEIVDISESGEAIQRQRDGVPVTTPYESWLRFWRGASCGVGVIYC